MNYWIFQGNPDIFDIDSYIKNNRNINWTVRQKHLTALMNIGDEVFIWRSAGKAKGVAGIIAYGKLESNPQYMTDDEASRNLWMDSQPDKVDLRVNISIDVVCSEPKTIVKREWLKDDPITSNLRILKMASETNYHIHYNEAQRLKALVRNTGKDWSFEESIAGLWAYTQTRDSKVSRLPETPIANVALTIGRAITGVYNKVMNFRAIDPSDIRKGLSAGSKIDEEVWNKYYDPVKGKIREDELSRAYNQLWGICSSFKVPKLSYSEFGDAPNDDPNEIQQFAAKVRKGQPSFRKNLLAAYGKECAITGHGPENVLEAIHIIDHAESGINELDNGLLMRSDLHYLFDSNLLRINPDALTVMIGDSLKNTPYWQLNGKVIKPRIDGSQISPKYLKQRWNKITD